MTAPTALDGDLAWAISEWNDDTAGMPSTVSKLSRREIETLTLFLTSQGFGKVKKDGELGDLGIVSELIRIKPAVDSLRNLARSAEEYLKGPRDTTNT